MRFHVILPVRDEADIIGHCLRQLLTWADAVYVFDTGSVDETWEIVGELASGDRRVRLLGKDPVYFSETRLRGWMFHQARRHMADGDWFLRADADEFHHVPPPEFVRTRLRPHETIVLHQYYDFRLTAAEVEAWQAGRETLADRARPIAERRRWFSVSAYSEPRLCRYRSTMRWPPTVSFPFNAGFRARARLPIRHYPHRDPLQLEQRCRLRRAMMADAENRRHWRHPDAHHWSQGDWRSFVLPADHPDLRYWKPGSPLPEFHFTDHLARPHVRAAQRIAHACLLPTLDRLRPQYPADAYPEHIPADDARRISAQVRGHVAAPDSAAGYGQTSRQYGNEFSAKRQDVDVQPSDPPAVFTMAGDADTTRPPAIRIFATGEAGAAGKSLQ